ncbi:MAG: Fic family protein [Bacteroidota bacterium]
MAKSLKELKKLQDKGIVAIKSDMLSRTNRERLLSNNFISEVYKGWYIATPSDITKGDSTSWYSNYWDFCSQYLEDRFNESWCISPEQSLLIHTGNKTIPKQIIVRSPEANNSKTDLPFNTSLFLLKADLPSDNERDKIDGLRIYTLASSLVRCSANTYVQNALDVRTALSLIRDPSEILAILLDGGHSVVAGRLSAAFKNVGMVKIANRISMTMEKAGYAIREVDPFDKKLMISFSQRTPSPYESRIRLMWLTMRKVVIENFPKEPGIPEDKQAYLKSVEEVYVTDAYHSLSIEKYLVTPELIEKVRTGNWDANKTKENQAEKDAMAAKGYWDAFNAVELSIKRILDGENSGLVVDEDHGTWYGELFGPSVVAGILKASDLAGYRTNQVYIGNSMHTPPNKDAVRDVMPLLFELLAEESEASVRAVLGHFIFVFIHPYPDGNGRMGRFLMNSMLASGGYPWTVIPVEQRTEYMEALEEASVRQNIEPFAKLLGTLVEQGLKGNPVAKLKA